ncbi:MAG: hypothetical protein UY31_C0044G0004 [Candidatus Wolfebacteria bacterium GW2011_GWE1_48_7]|uniref:Uncharacterized protein n=2 Tax=Candidatus Wolfeibacteriota TaxID=1752735 RepID=A0A0G1U6Q6_9BACT|nr:MAG: hypothetical protein UX70_C0001G0913 [Candidatus Wolfebacteria bacterium GW2011_GWB1_47_1]KKU36956.1 MAG: hypothetical protein UX49_C0005G0033 [Candidatus Wolfebacteria bacterium GW2011_GWC2_46_275]KKU42198.1 MAG: hypothetical protein UX58_C0003G0123 [Candidatus Wolfebacteria bacterium GW2011_GWB2_46_69]KKU53820.1 MAG: hypothetical protein UX76_C0009G0010 [Candidatus Wolfebacteria bacterium GW2011_GWC1_47_103]KKU59451.1 MAG: hypothetical protein UX83_C0005G0070 [Candidatus Wolfebacteria
MKTFEEYFRSDRKFEDAPAAIQEKIRRLCGIGKKLLFGNITQAERSYLNKKAYEILEVNEDGYFDEVAAEVENALPGVLFNSSLFVLLPNGIVVEEAGNAIRFHARDKALLALMGELEEEYMQAMDEWTESQEAFEEYWSENAVWLSSNVLFVK